MPSIFKAFPSYLQPKPIKIRKLPAQRNQLRIGKNQCISRYIKLNSEFDLGAYGHRLNTVFDILDQPILEPICEPILEPILEPVEPICGSNSSTAENLAESSNYCDKEVQTSDSYTSELKLKRKIKYLHQKLRRTQKKVDNLEDLVNNLKNYGHIDSEQQNIIIKYFSGTYL